MRANRAFADDYRARAEAPPSGARRPRALVTGFGRFLHNPTNATGQIVTRLLPDLRYPLTEPPGAEVDPPGPQLAVAQGLIELPRAGEVELCAMVLPVFWDLAAFLVLREIEAFVPDLVVMNGVAGPRQSLWLELGAQNRAKDAPDGSNVLRPATAMAPLVAGASEARSNLASWEAIADAARRELEARAGVVHDVERLDAVLQGVAFAGFPRTSNAYLCNATTYVVGHALDHPGEAIALMQSSDGDVRYTAPSAEGDRRSAMPRWFMHWPSALDGVHLDAAADVLRAVVDAQLLALEEGPPPTPGDNALADVPAAT